LGVEVHHLAARLRVRHDQVVADAEVERQTGALAPIVLPEATERAAAQADVPGTELDGRSLRDAEQKVGEVQPDAALDAGPAACIPVKTKLPRAFASVWLSDQS
jgi:hypothetical protein